MAEGVKAHVPAEFLEMAISGGHTWTETQACLEIAKLVFDAYTTRGEAPNLDHNPFAQRMANLMVQKAQQQACSQAQLQAVATPVPTTQKDAATEAQDMAAAAGLS